MGVRSFLKSLGVGLCKNGNDEAVHNHYEKDREGSFPLIYLPDKRSTEGFHTEMSIPDVTATTATANASIEEEEEMEWSSPMSPSEPLSPPTTPTHSTHSSRQRQQRHSFRRRSAPRPWSKLADLDEDFSSPPPAAAAVSPGDRIGDIPQKQQPEKPSGLILDDDADNSNSNNNNYYYDKKPKGSLQRFRFSRFQSRFFMNNKTRVQSFFRGSDGGKSNNNTNNINNKNQKKKNKGSAFRERRSWDQSSPSFLQQDESHNSTAKTDSQDSNDKPLPFQTTTTTATTITNSGSGSGSSPTTLDNHKMASNVDLLISLADFGLAEEEIIFATSKDDKDNNEPPIDIPNISVLEEKKQDDDLLPTVQQKQQQEKECKTYAKSVKDDKTSSHPLDDTPARDNTSAAMHKKGVASPRIIFISDQDKDDEIGGGGGDDKKAYLKRTLRKPPVSEIRGHERTISDMSEISNVSYQSSVASSSNPFEFSLETGFKEHKAAQLMAASEDIVRSLQRQEHRQQVKALDELIHQTDHQRARALKNHHLNTTTPTTNNNSKSKNADQDAFAIEPMQFPPLASKCLILIMDPRKRIFEIVQVPYQAETTTVAELLEQLPLLATDKRLARLNFSGVAHEGQHVAPSQRPVDMILEAQAQGKPLYAIPHKYSAEQIQTLGDNLLETPRVAKLLQGQWDKLEARKSIRPALNQARLILASLQEQQMHQGMTSRTRALDQIDDDDDVSASQSLSSLSTLSPRQLLDPLTKKGITKSKNNNNSNNTKETTATPPNDTSSICSEEHDADAELSEDDGPPSSYNALVIAQLKEEIYEV